MSDLEFEGPALPPDSDPDDAEVVGPLPEGFRSGRSDGDARRLLDERALRMKIDSLGGPSSTGRAAESREEWMLVPPDVGPLPALTSRQFRAREGPDTTDRSSWTDTPERKAAKTSGVPDRDGDADRLRREAERRRVEERDAEQESAARKHKKKSRRKESLMEMHTKRLKKKKKKEARETGEKKSERRRFDRDVDLAANRFDEAQKRAVLKKAQLLDSRFSSGESKYL